LSTRTMREIAKKLLTVHRPVEHMYICTVNAVNCYVVYRLLIMYKNIFAISHGATRQIGI
jgi:hypothetical protein